MLSTIFSFLFPDYCLGCRKKGELLCKSCLAHAPHSLEDAGGLKAANARAIFAYKNPAIKKALHFLKYNRARRIADIFGLYLYEEMIEEVAEELLLHGDNPLLVVPIPLYSKRLRERGFNQSELLARSFAKYNLEKLIVEPSVLIKTRQTKNQMELKRRERLENLEGCFSIKSPETIHGHIIILIDDIITTGATMREAKKVLLQSGARKVICLAVAH
ncbi:MAG: phosphoribosyltransferase family protein [Candidatus Paceibacterota bacterium]|jgi:ComF family protein